MVLWEITAATAYFLGLKRTYRIALRFQRRIFGPRHPKIRQFLHRRTRAIFQVAVNVHKRIQLRDLEAGKSIGNYVLRFLDRMKPSAEIRSSAQKQPNIRSGSGDGGEITLKNNSFGGANKLSDKSPGQGWDDNRRNFTSFGNSFLPFSTFVMMNPTKQTGIHSRPHRHDVFRRDIALWMYGK